jgi:flavin reductase (DIM6/NTAB) family NADH-FMN oxidoreductase RutF
MSQSGAAALSIAADFRAVMGRLPAAVTVVTTYIDDAPIGCTVSAVMSLSLEPPSLLISLRTGASTLDAITRAGAFAVNVLSWRQRELCQRFAAAPARERFDGVPYHLRLGVPVLMGSSASVVCALHDAMDVADHTLVIGRPSWQGVGDDDGHPVVWLRRDCRQVR